MKRNKFNSGCRISIFLSALVFVGISQAVLGQNTQNPGVVSTQSGESKVLYDKIKEAASSLINQAGEKMKFCVKDPQLEFDRAFNLSSNPEFFTSCMLKTGGDAVSRICSKGEVDFYFKSSILRQQKANRNCNATSWGLGCEPGWACALDASASNETNINSTAIPLRSSSCQPCCEGFFCPRGMTCMLPCPLGAYCGSAKLNEMTGTCDPYQYQVGEGRNISCGGADIWAEVGRSRGLFCPEGSFCPSTIQNRTCGNGYYCRLGSTAREKCFKLTSCDSNAANQNIHAYGVMIIVVLTFLLVVMYNCSDHILLLREKRMARAREAAAIKARSTARAMERWKLAKEIAKRHAIELQKQATRTFSRRLSTRSPKDKPLLPTFIERSHGQSSTNKIEPSGIDKVQRVEEYPEDEIVKEKSKPKHKHSKTQMFIYAYDQIEKENAQIGTETDSVSFTGVVSMATTNKEKKRPTIEVAFRDLTLTLKGKNKHLLRCVTGKIMPGRVSAVMGPSGAGKTTFLNAVSGKATGCKVTGSVLVNGKTDPIHCYRKIVGFVPQDDIVHGNLTVEENLWFNARCRLPANMSKEDKVLVVERVIHSLGLEAVRDSLVGTVEKRGISGGQRKRVNVGMEMVIEPSLLILDEPTSGLDSSSSLLLLRSLRREAHEGVNICMVLHQPSYSLFRMFDDLILLAKGGFTVYHGPVSNVEEYFSNLGILVPDRINPPDHYIDVLEGMVKTNSSVNYKDLPIKWMMYNGYKIPEDLQQENTDIDTSASAETSENAVNNRNNVSSEEDQTFAEDIWQDVVSNIEIKKTTILSNFLKANDLSGRRTPNFLFQYRYFVSRMIKQRLREARIQAMDYLILLLAGACLGTITKMNDESFGAPGYTYTIIAVSLLCKIAALRSFSLDKLHYWRESASGMSSLAYFLAKDTVDHFNTVIKPVFYLSMFYFFNTPRSSFSENYIVLLSLVYCVTGIGYALAILLEPGSAQLWSVLLPVVFTLVATQQRQNGLLKLVSSICYPKWTLEAFVVANASRYSGVWLITRCGALMKFSYNINNWAFGIYVLIGYGAVARTIAYICMITFQKK